MILVVVYADILLIINTFVNFFIIRATSKITKAQEVKIIRQVLASFLGATFSFYIFLPDMGLLIELLVRLFASVSIIFVCYGFGKLKRFLTLIVVFYLVSFSYAGIMMAIWFIFSPDGLVIKNGIVYYNFSPIVLVVVTLVSYFIILFFRQISHKQASEAKRCEIIIALENNQIRTNAMVDTGHSLKDLFSSSPVIVVEQSVMEKLIGKQESLNIVKMKETNSKELKKRFRLIPYRTVQGEGILPAIRCDQVGFFCDLQEKKIKNPLVAVSNTALGEDYSAIISSEMIS